MSIFIDNTNNVGSYKKNIGGDLENLKGVHSFELDLEVGSIADIKVGIFPKEKMCLVFENMMNTRTEKISKIEIFNDQENDNEGYIYQDITVKIDREIVKKMLNLKLKFSAHEAAEILIESFAQYGGKYGIDEGSVRIQKDRYVEILTHG